MNACAIIIGNEILKGNTVETNGQYLIKRLFELGISLKEIRIVEDDIPSITAALNDLTNSPLSPQIIITTGGLGPTLDDLTKKALCNFLNCPLIESTAAIPLIQKQYQRFQKKWEPVTSQYHMLPQGSFPIENLCGLAPGIGYNLNSKLILMAPGVPSELKSMAEYAWPLLIKKLLPTFQNKTQQITIKTTQITEQEIFKTHPKL